MLLEERCRRRSLLKASLACGGLLFPIRLPAQEIDPKGHGFSPIGDLKYPPHFASFDYVNAEAPKGGVMRLARFGTFYDFDILGFPSQPAADIQLLYDRLLVASDDERASYYGLLAKSIEVSGDLEEFHFVLREGARWHDGRPVTSADIAFTLAAIKSRGSPFLRQAAQPLQVVVEDDRSFTIRNSRLDDREAISTIASIPIHPEHVWGGTGPVDANEVIGSGPYRIGVFDPPRRFTLERVTDYWARDLPPNRGRWNFDRLQFDYYSDDNVSLEAFRADYYDVRFEDDPRRWATGYDSVTPHQVLRSEIKTPGGSLHGLVFNLRRANLSAHAMRLALSLTYDFHYVNSSFFHGAHERWESVFGNNELAAVGAAAAGERALLDGVSEVVPTVVLANPDPFFGLPEPGSRQALRLASSLLEDAGFPVINGARIDATTGDPLRFRVLSPEPFYDPALAVLRNAAERIGVSLERISVDPSSGMRMLLDRDFDLATLSWEPAPLPGSVERMLWHSDLEDQVGSYALSGIRSEALDVSIEAMGRARDVSALKSAAHLFDRLFRHKLLMLPLWRANTIRVARWDRFGTTIGTNLPLSPEETWWATSKSD